MDANKVWVRIDFVTTFGNLWISIALKDALSAAFGWATVVNVAALASSVRSSGFQSALAKAGAKSCFTQQSVLLWA